MDLNAETLEQFMQNQGIMGRIINVSVPTLTVETAAEAVGTTPEKIVKSLLFLVDGRPTLVVSSGTSRVDRKKLAKYFDIGRERVKLADPETVRALTGYEVGAVPPFGHRQTLDVILEESIFKQSSVYAGGGSTQALLEITPKEILRVTKAEILNLHVEPLTDQD
jgi:Cys-tRNA(Pro) deacylase